MFYVADGRTDIEDEESPSKKKFWRHKNEGWAEEEWERKPIKRDG